MRPFFLPTLKQVLIKPEDFFDRDIRRMQRWAQPISYLLVFTVIIAFFFSSNVKKLFLAFAESIIKALGVDYLLLSYEPTMWSIAGLFLLLVIVLMLATSFKYWVAHWYVRIWNKKATFKHTYAVLTYGGTPGWIAMPFFTLTMYFLYMAYFNGGPSNWLLTFLSAAVWLTLEGYSIYLRVYALAKVQKITKLQAALSVYVLGLITYFVGVIVIEVLLGLFIGLILILFA